MKKQTIKILSIVFALVVILSLSACGASRSPVDKDAADMATQSKYSADYSYAENGADNSELSVTPQEADAGFSTPIRSSEKIIYTGSANIETQDFDKTLTDIEKLVASSGGYIQSSSVSGNDYYSAGSGYRSASYVLCIPVDKFDGVMNGLSSLGNVPYSSMNADNITQQYTDTQARLTARQTEEGRLLELLAKADTVEEMLSIEDHLSDVRCEIESLTAQIKNWDTLISYSTLTLNVSEVTLYTNGVPSTASYGSQLVAGLKNSAKHVWQFLKDLLRFIISALPVLALIAAVAVPALLIIRKAVRKRRAKAKKSDGTDSKQE